MKKAPRYWYDAMDKFFVEKKLAEHPELEEKYSINYSSFKRFCYLVMQYYGWQDIEQLQKEFDNETFFNIKFKRMYQTNVKKWKKYHRKFLKEMLIHVNIVAKLEEYLK